MKKRIAVLVMTVVLALSMVACGTPKCKHSGCEDAATEGGYCSYHAAMNDLDSAAKNAFDGFFGK